MAEALLRARLADRAPEVEIGSVGLLFDDRSAERGAVKAMAKRGIDLEPFRSRKMTTELLEGSSLVLGMERSHVREAAVLGDGIFGHAFTLRELVADVELFGPRRDESLRDWATRIGRVRTPVDYLVEERATSVVDPMGRSSRAFRACAEELDGLIERLVSLAWPPPVKAPAGTSAALPSVNGGT
jgi:protein-tyrosine-phosphatase